MVHGVDGKCQSVHRIWTFEKWIIEPLSFTDESHTIDRINDHFAIDVDRDRIHINAEQ